MIRRALATALLVIAIPTSAVLAQETMAPEMDVGMADEMMDPMMHDDMMMSDDPMMMPEDPVMPEPM